MALMELFLIFVLQFEGISGQPDHLYHRSGNDVILPCGRVRNRCYWSYNKNPFLTFHVVSEGRVYARSDKFSRLSVDSNCSLGIKNITAEDAGLYSCLYLSGAPQVTLSETFLNILTLSASPSHTDSKRDGDVTLECSLVRYSALRPCKENNIRWVDETGTVLLNSKFSDNDVIKCVSLLTVKPQSGHNKTYTCQFVGENSVKIDAHYPPVFTGISGQPQQHYFYHRSGNDVILPCDRGKDSCSSTEWIYNKNPYHFSLVVREGRVVQSSDKFSRLSVHSNCSLGIKNITAEDAGFYICLYPTSSNPIIFSEVFLNILTLSASPSHTDSKRDGDVTLECSLFSHSALLPCKRNYIRWVDETGTVLLSSKFSETNVTKCASLLTVKPQSGHNKRYTCQFVGENSVLTDVHYPPVLTGISGQPQQHYFYHRSGNDVILPCDRGKDSCSSTEWIYNKNPDHFSLVVREGRVSESSDKFSRLSVHSNCSLGIKNITAEDAGFYICLYPTSSNPIIFSEVFLNILTLSASPSHTDSKRDGDVTLECSLFGVSFLCNWNNIRWVDETGTVLLNSKFSETNVTKCASLLTVKPQSGHNKRYTCQFVEENSVMTDAHYPPVFTDSAKLSPLSYVIMALCTAGLILMIAATVLVIRRIRRKKQREDSNVHYIAHHDDGTVKKENVGNGSAGPELH